MTSGTEPLLAARLTVRYGERVILNEVAFSMAAGQRFGLVGESGSGKSSVALALLGLLGYRGGSVQGSIRFDGEEWLGRPDSQWRSLRGRLIGLVPQSPTQALNPALDLEGHLAEAWLAHSRVPWSKQRPETLALLERLRLPAEPSFLRRLPRQISAGQAQRVLLAAALLHRPRLLIADEPTSALDTMARQEVLAVLREITEAERLALLLISHDLDSVVALCSETGWMNAGQLTVWGSTCSVIQTEYDSSLNGVRYRLGRRPE